MKILFITHYPSLYGANLSMLTIIRKLKTCDYEILVLVPGFGQLTDTLEIENINYQVLDIYPSVWKFGLFEFLKLPYKYFRFLYSIFKINGFVNIFKPDLIYSNGSVLVNGCIVSILNNIKHIWHLREYGKLDYNLTHFIPNFFYSFLLKKSNINICISESILNHFKIKSPFANFQLVYNGICNKNQPLNRINSHERFNFLVLGFISPEKNTEEAIRAFNTISKKIPDATIDIIGNGDFEYLSFLENLVFELKINDKVNFLGYINNSEINFLNYDFFILCSKNEAFGRVIVEAMENGLIVFANNSGGVSEIIKHDYNGFLYSSGFENLSNVISEKILISDFDEIRINAFNYVIKHFSVSSYVNNINLLIKKLFNNY